MVSSCLLIDFDESGAEAMNLEGMCFVTPKKRGFCAFASHLGFKLSTTGQCAFTVGNSAGGVGGLGQVVFNIHSVKLMKFCYRS